MIIAVSPYHLTTREPPAMASLLLADSIVTFMPGVFRADEQTAGGGTRENVRAAAQSSPRYARLLESWAWSMPLWHAGVAHSSFEADDAAGDIRAAWDRLLADDRYAAMRPFVKHSLGEDPRAMIDAVAADVLKGGPDPAILVPLLAGLDRFTARHRLISARAEPSSIAQKAEAALASPIGRIVIPVLLQASAGAILLARQELEPELNELRDAFSAAAALALERPRPSPEAVETAIAALRRAALAYEQAFSRALPILHSRQDRDDVPLRPGPISITIAALPADAVLRSSCAAASTLLGARPRAAASSRAPTSTLPVLADPLDHGTLAALTFKPLGR